MIETSMIPSIYFRISSFLEKNTIYIILFFAFILRVNGLNFGLPYLPNEDEHLIVNPVLRILSTGDMNPHYFTFPGSFIMYLLAALFSALFGIYYVYYFLSGKVHHISEFKGLIGSHATLNTTLPYYSGRLLMVIFAIISVYLVYMIARKLFNNTVGILAAFCLSMAPLYVKASRIIRPDITESMLILFSFYFFLLFFEENREIKYLIAASVVAGLGIATKYPAAIIVFPILFYCLMADFSGSRSLFFSKALLCIAIGFFVFAPFVILDYHTALRNILFEATNKTLWWPERLSGIHNDIWYFKASLINGIGGVFFTIFAGLGLLVLLIKRTSKVMYFLFFPVAYYIVMVDLGKLRFERWLIPVLPYEAILFGLGVFTFYKYFEQRRPVLQIMAWMFLGLFIFTSVSVIERNINDGIKISRRDSRMIAKDWIEKNVPSGSKIVFENETPPLRRNKINNFDLIDLGKSLIVDKPLSYYQGQSVNYLIINNNARDLVFSSHSDQYNVQIRRYKELKDKVQLIKAFYYKSNPGPGIEVYKLK